MPKRVEMSHYGAPEVLQLVERTLPPLGTQEIRFRVLAAAVNHADLEIRAGHWQILAPTPFPYTPGLEAVGEVIEVGPSVEHVHVGDRVITMMQKLGGIHGIRPGGYQEVVTVNAETVALLPLHLDPLAIAALGLAAVTAYEGLKRLHLEPDERLIIHGATGGVGSVAIQMAKALGVEVIATTGSTAKDTYLRELGVTTIVHLGTEGLVTSLGARTIDAVFDTIGGTTFTESVAVLKRGGRLSLVGASAGDQLLISAWDLLQDLHLTGYSSENLTGTALREDMQIICSWLEQGKITAPTTHHFPLAQAAEVHARMERRELVGRSLLGP
jgi:NADPH:quinone reductase